MSTRERPSSYVLVTGGAGFIGTNVADRFLHRGTPVLILDDLSRAGVAENARWLAAQHGGLVDLLIDDVRDPEAVRQAVSGASAVVHLAAQVAVTTSLVAPREDFLTNALGTLNVLEAIRELPAGARPPLVYTSTNKVYGELHGLELEDGASRHEPRDEIARARGISETQPLDFASPYGCSKGTADQYVLDYARTFRLPAVVFRMSCIYGPHQHGTEDQGWVAHFVIRSLEGQRITIYGDGKQVRDLLYVDDLVDAFLAAFERMPAIAGHAFNMGGGPSNAASLVELLAALGGLRGEEISASYEPWRASDQRWFVSDTRKFQEATGWHPRVDWLTGLRRLHEWLARARGLDARRVAA